MARPPSTLMSLSEDTLALVKCFTRELGLGMLGLLALAAGIAHGAPILAALTFLIGALCARAVAAQLRVIDDAVQGLRDDPDFAEVLGFFSTHQANEFDGSLEYLIEKLVEMDTNQDGVIEWSEFRAVVFPPPPSEMDIYMQNYENYLHQVFLRCSMCNFFK